MKNKIFCFAFSITFIVIITGVYKGDITIIESGTSLLFFMLMAFIGSTISEVRKRKINLGVLKIVIPLFLISIGSLIYGINTNNILIPSVISLLLGIFSCTLLLRSKAKCK